MSFFFGWGLNNKLNSLLLSNNLSIQMFDIKMFLKLHWFCYLVRKEKLK